MDFITLFSSIPYHTIREPNAKSFEDYQKSTNIACYLCNLGIQSADSARLLHSRINRWVSNCELFSSVSNFVTYLTIRPANQEKGTMLHYSDTSTKIGFIELDNKIESMETAIDCDEYIIFFRKTRYIQRSTNKI